MLRPRMQEILTVVRIDADAGIDAAEILMIMRIFVSGFPRI